MSNHAFLKICDFFWNIFWWKQYSKTRYWLCLIRRNSFWEILSLTCDQNWSSLNNMLWAFKPCPLEINSDGRLKREHLESSSSALKALDFHNHHNAYGQKIWNRDDLTWGISIHKVRHDLLITWSFEIMWQTKTIISLLPECLWPPDLAGW